MASLDRRGRIALATGAVVVGFFLAGALLPNGLPLGIVLHGMVLGGLTALTAMGLVLVYRTSRIVNFAQAEIGVLASTVGIVMVAGWHLPYLVAAPVGLAVAVGTGALIDLVVVRRLFTAPRLILTVATVGILQVVGALEVTMPTWFGHLTVLTRFRTPWTSFNFTVGPTVFRGDDVAIMIVVPLVCLAMAAFLSRSDTGIAVRAAADSNERALLLGIPVRRLSLITWMVAGGLSGLASLLYSGSVGAQLGAVGGPELLLPALAAAVVAGMESLPVAVGAALAINVMREAVFWSYSRSTAVDVVTFAVVLIALLAQRRRLTRVDDSGLGGYVAVREVRPVPAVLRGLAEVRWARVAGLVALLAASVLIPMALSDAKLILVTYIALYGIVAVSLVVLTGWAGQISLGQFAFVGIGAGTTAGLLVHAGADLFVALLMSSLAGAVAAVLVGIPALRIPGLFLAVATLALAVPVSTYLLNSAYFPSFAPHQVNRPIVLKRFDLESNLAFYYLCLAGLVVAVVLARNFRRSRAGRAIVAVRDNERGASAYAVSPVRAKLAAFAFSGALAGFAGGLYAVAQRGIGFAGFDPILSLEIFVVVVIGGLGSVPGALLGAVYVGLVETYLHGGAALLATGGGLLGVLMILPGGLGELVYRVRDWLLRRLAATRGLSVPSLAEHPAFESDDAVVANGQVVHESPRAGGLVRVDGVDAGYGQIQVLFDVDAHVDDGEIVALLGTNGAGKSTLLRVIAGLLPPSEGRVWFEGRDITDLGPVERVREGLVTVPGGRGVFSSLTVAENLRLAGWLSRRDPAFIADAQRRVFELFPILAERQSQRAGLLSGGQQQMLTLAQALLCRPRVLMIDELSLGLAPAVVSTLLDVVRQINASGVAVVVVEQSVNVATTLAERAVFMEKGQVRFTGATADLTGRDDLLRSVFLGSATPARAKTSNGQVTGPAPPRLVVTDVSRRFGGVSAVDEVSLEVGEGQILGIIGSNGAGKTTLFDICSGFLRPDAGRLSLDGADVTDLGAAERAELGLGRVFQDARLFPSLTVAETLATALERHVEVRDPLACIFRVGAVVDSEAAVRARVDELIELMNLDRYRDAFVSELSTGTRRIVELACALAHEPRVLLLDEPSSGIAQRESEALAGLLLRIRDETGASLAVIEHDIPLVSSIADELVALHLGRVIARGAPNAVLEDPAVVASYLGRDETTIARSGVTATKRRRRPLVAAGR